MHWTRPTNIPIFVSMSATIRRQYLQEKSIFDHQSLVHQAVSEYWAVLHLISHRLLLSFLGRHSVREHIINIPRPRSASSFRLSFSLLFLLAPSNFAERKSEWAGLKLNTIKICINCLSNKNGTGSLDDSLSPYSKTNIGLLLIYCRCMCANYD